MSKAHCVHHMDYQLGTMLGRNRHRLMALCRKCHTAVECPQGRRHRGDKRTLKERLLRERMMAFRGISYDKWAAEAAPHSFAEQDELVRVRAKPPRPLPIGRPPMPKGRCSLYSKAKRVGR